MTTILGTEVDQPLVVSVSREADSVRLAVRGELDVHTADVFDGGIDHALRAGFPLVIDLSMTTFVGSCGLAAVVRARREVDDVTVVIGRAIQRCLFEATGVDQLVTLVDHADAR